jgi:putative hydrolase of the HAD superfamily
MPPLAFTSRDDAHLIEQERNWWSALVRQVVTPGGLIADFGGFFDTLYAHFSQGSAWRAYPEAASVLRSLKSRGYRIGIVSNFDSRLEAILEELGLNRWADVTVYSSRAGAAKPNPAIFRHALRLLGVHPHESLHVGDNHDADYAGARAAGMRAAIVNRKSEDGPDDGVIRIRSLEHVDELLR